MSSPTPPKTTLGKAFDALLWVAIAGVLFLAVMPKDSGPKVGKIASTHELTIVGGPEDGQTRPFPGKLSRPLLVEAFASWCGVCRRESALLADLKDAQDKGLLDVVAVSVDDSRKKALKAKNSWPIVVDVLHDATGSFSRDYQVKVLPTYILIGVDGKVARVTGGGAGASDIRAWLKAGEN